MWHETVDCPCCGMRLSITRDVTWNYSLLVMWYELVDCCWCDVRLLIVFGMAWDCWLAVMWCEIIDCSWCRMRLSIIRGLVNVLLSYPFIATVFFTIILNFPFKLLLFNTRRDMTRQASHYICSTLGHKLPDLVVTFVQHSRDMIRQASHHICSSIGQTWLDKLVFIFVHQSDRHDQTN